MNPYQSQVDFRIPTGKTVEYIAEDFTSGGNESGEFIYNSEGSESELRNNSLILFWQRIQDIHNGEDYNVSPGCVFYGDIKDSVDPALDQGDTKEPLGEAAPGINEIGGLDGGFDVDLFVIDLEQTSYSFTAEGIASSDVDLGNSWSNPTRPSDHNTVTVDSLSEIEPTIRLLTEDGTVVASAVDNAGSFHHDVTNAGTYHVEISKGNTSWDAAGGYNFIVIQTDEGDADLAGDISTAADLSATGSINAQITDGDDDWFRVSITANEMATVLLTDLENRNSRSYSLELHNEDGSGTSHRISNTNYKSEGHAIMEILTEDGGDYFVSVTGNEEKTGAYTIELPLVDDDHRSALNTGLVAWTHEDTLSGTLNTPWDVDRTRLTIPQRLQWIVAITPVGSILFETELVLDIQNDPDNGFTETFNISRYDGSAWLINTTPRHADPWTIHNVANHDSRNAIISVRAKNPGDEPISYVLSAWHGNDEVPVFKEDQHTVEDINRFNDPAMQAIPFDEATGTGSISGTLKPHSDGTRDIDTFHLGSLPGGRYSYELIVNDEDPAVVGFEMRYCWNAICQDWGVFIDNSTSEFAGGDFKRSMAIALRNTYEPSVVNWEFIITKLD